MSPLLPLLLLLLALATGADANALFPAPTGLKSAHPRVVLRHRPGKKKFQGIELHYFCLRGLGELPRLMLEATETPYDSVMYFNTNEYKQIGQWGQMPLLKMPHSFGEDFLAQSSTIVRHIAQVTGLDARHGKANVVARAKIDSVYEVSRDIAGKKTAVHIEGGAQGSESQEYKRLHTYLLNATAALGDDEWWANSPRMTYADVAMFAALHGLEEAKSGFLAAHGYVTLSEFVSRVESLPRIAEYLQSPRRLPLTEKESGNVEGGYEFKTALNPEVYAELYDPSDAPGYSTDPPPAPPAVEEPPAGTDEGEDNNGGDEEKEEEQEEYDEEEEEKAQAALQREVEAAFQELEQEL